MNTEPSEREEAPERLKRIRDQAARRVISSVPQWSDINFLLSLLDGQMEFSKRFAEKTYVGQYEAINDAATRMRERCVAEVIAIKDEYRAKGTYAQGNGTFDYVAKRLKSLTIEAAANSVKDNEGNNAPEA